MQEERNGLYLDALKVVGIDLLLAAYKEKKIRQIRESTGNLDQVNIDLTFYVFYNLANMYHAN